jgi:hypothetical protein
MDQLWHTVFDTSMHQPWLYFCYRFDASVMKSVMDSTHQLSLSFQGWFLGLQGLSFRWRFMDQRWHNVFDNSMHRPWLYFCYRFHTSAGIQFSVMISISFRWRFMDSHDIAFLKIPCVGHDSIFAINLMRRSWINGRCRFHMSAGTQYSLTVSRSIVTVFGDNL